jgi:Xaa-Pro aminopeptidase
VTRIPHLYPADRLARARELAGEAGFDALLISPGADLRYLTGYAAKALERLTCLVIPLEGEPFIVVPRLERAAAEVPLAGKLEIIDWDETEDPYALVASRLDRDVARIAVDNRMWAEKVLAFQRVLPNARQEAASTVLREMRMRKSPEEVRALREAGQAIDKVHESMARWLRPGRTERQVARDIKDAIIAAGHVSADFAIVASGPHAASPHHDVSDRVIEAGEPIVVDIGGTTEAGYCSDSTRTYSIGEPPREFLDYYEVLLRAQITQVEAVRPGLTAERLDAIGREIIAGAGYGDHFIHRTGHGIGLEGHEEPYIVEGSTLPLEPGMAFSVEPGIYLAGRHGARIEDIVVCTDSGGERLNLTPRELTLL